MSVSEERASSDIENSFVKEKVDTVTPEKVKDDVKSDAMLDEIAAKVESLDFSKIQEDEDREDFHAKCMDTVKKQGETINTLVQQLRIMFDEYQAIDQEREYYEDLNDALIRCLEITEGKIQFESEEETENEEDITHLISKESEELCISQEKEEQQEKNVQNEAKTTEGATEGVTAEGATAADEKTGEDSDAESTKSEVLTKVLAKSELIRLNRILLREIFELRHQIDVMKANIREYFEEETDGSEYDTATDDEHVCEHCAPTKTEENDETAVVNKNENEEYEILDNEDDTKIKDEPDTE